MDKNTTTETKILRITPSVSQLKDVEGKLLQKVERSRILDTEKRPLSAEEFHCERLLVYVEDALKIWGGQGTELHTQANWARAYATAKGAKAYAFDNSWLARLKRWLKN